jgi:predicted dehydrogenase
MRNLAQNPLKIAILGCGAFAAWRILPMLKEVIGVRVVCIQNRSLAKAEALAQQYGIPRAVAHRKDLLADPEVEAVHITSPNFLHEEDALACAAAGLPTLCEKPLSTSLESVHRMLEAFQSRSIPFFVGHQMRFNPAVQKAKEILLSGELGTLLHLRTYFYARALPEGNWRAELGNGGGVLQEIGIHLIDLIHFLSGEATRDIRTVSPVGDRDQVAILQGRLVSGALISCECAYGSLYYNGFEVIGSKARLSSTNSLRQLESRWEPLFLFRESGEKISYELPATHVYLEEYQHFAKAIIEKASSPIEAHISCASQRSIDEANGINQ